MLKNKFENNPDVNPTIIEIKGSIIKLPIIPIWIIPANTENFISSTFISFFVAAAIPKEPIIELEKAKYIFNGPTIFFWDVLESNIKGNRGIMKSVPIKGNKLNQSLI